MATATMSAQIRKRCSTELNNNQGCTKRRSIDKPSSSAAASSGDRQAAGLSCSAPAMTPFGAYAPPFSAFMMPPPFCFMPPFMPFGTFVPNAAAFAQGMAMAPNALAQQQAPWAGGQQTWGQHMWPQQMAWRQQQMQSGPVSGASLSSEKTEGRGQACSGQQEPVQSSVAAGAMDCLEAVEFESFIDQFLGNNAGADDVLGLDLPLAGSPDGIASADTHCTSLEEPKPLSIKLSTSSSFLVDLADEPAGTLFL